MLNIWEKKKGHIFLIFVIFLIRKVPCLLKPSLWTSASSYFNFVCFRQCRTHCDTLSLLILVIMFNKSFFSRWFKSGIFQPHFGAYSRRERRYPYVKCCNSNASQKILWKQVVTCSGHSTEHFKTNLAEYWGWGGVHGMSSYLPDYFMYDRIFVFPLQAFNWYISRGVGKGQGIG